MDNFSKKVKLYIGIIVAIGVILAVFFINRFEIIFNLDVFIFIVMAIIAESLLIPLPNQGGVSVGFAIVLPSMIFWPCHCYVNHPIGKLINGGKTRWKV